jgi:hypothetical protein
MNAFGGNRQMIPESQLDHENPINSKLKFPKYCQKQGKKTIFIKK